MSQIIDWTLRGADEETIFGNTHLPDSVPKGVVILSHGFKGYKDYGFFPKLAESLAQAGMIAHRFNFSHSGMTNNIEVFERIDLFEKDTWDKQIADLTNVIKAVDTGDLHGRGKDIVLFGHSRGGITTLLTASRLNTDKILGGLIEGVITAAAPSDACNLNAQERSELKAKGRLLSPSGRTGQDLHVGAEWLLEMEADWDSYDPIKAVERIDRPLCIVHGNDDPTVPVASAHTLAEAATKKANRVIIPKANHVFNAPNPLSLNDKLPGVTSTFIETVVRFSENCFESHN